MYVIGEQYTRNDVYELLQLPLDQRTGDWLNGYHRHGTDYYIFCNLGDGGRTGHNYPNRWKGPILIWYGKTRSHFDQSSIANLISGDYRVLVFYRCDNRRPFTFAGIGRPIPHYGTRHPVRIDWRFTSEESVPVSID